MQIIDAKKILANYQDPAALIKQIYVEEGVSNLPYTQEILQRAGTTGQVITGQKPPGMEELSGTGDFIQGLNKGKQTLVLTENRGKFFKPCPATREYRCCDYHVLNIGMNCPLDCVYCILQAYLNNPWLSYFVNTAVLIDELDEIFRQAPDEFFRIGTGEFTDSLVLDSLTHLSPVLVEYMRDKSRSVLELKTKSAAIGNLIGLDHGGRTIVAWSLNSSKIMEREELKTANLKERLAAAAICAADGYKLAFHFDPIIFHPGWQEGYAATIDYLFANIDPDKIAWISLGALRFLPALKNIATSRFPNSRFFHEEFVLGLDNKFRYFRGLRTEMYKFIYAKIKAKVSKKTCVYLCMESDEIWRDVFGYTPEEKGGLPKMLDRTIHNPPPKLRA